METKIFVNLPVRDLKKSMDFYSNIGFTNEPKFTDDTAACMVLSDEVYVMLLTHDKFKQFTPKKISDASIATEVINALSIESKQKIDELMKKVISAGGSEVRPAEDLGFMFSRSFYDPDSHIWELFWMDSTQA